ncbi:GL25341 [Drosophila persimilis]|uniref:GL25341 n=1 Tax=Drosophila persimilis TaxID=7234 RepID=B4IQU8_DROPE|nr:GL25341 [Drosophila persimilis]
MSSTFFCMSIFLISATAADQGYKTAIAYSSQACPTVRGRCYVARIGRRAPADGAASYILEVYHDFSAPSPRRYGGVPFNGALDTEKGRYNPSDYHLDEIPGHRGMPRISLYSGPIGAIGALASFNASWPSHYGGCVGLVDSYHKAQGQPSHGPHSTERHPWDHHGDYVLRPGITNLSGDSFYMDNTPHTPNTQIEKMTEEAVFGRRNALTRSPPPSAPAKAQGSSMFKPGPDGKEKERPHSVPLELLKNLGTRANELVKRMNDQRHVDNVMKDLALRVVTLQALVVNNFEKLHTRTIETATTGTQLVNSSEAAAHRLKEAARVASNGCGAHKEAERHKASASVDPVQTAGAVPG